MRIAIPSEGDGGLKANAAAHFGRCPVYTVVDDSGVLIDLLKVSDDVMMHSKLPPDFLKEHRIDVVVCRDMGAKATMLCSKVGIKTYAAMGRTVEEMYGLWKSGMARLLNPGEGCEH